MLRLDTPLARRIEASEAEVIFSMRSAVAKLPGNPYGLYARRFDTVVALACPTKPYEGFINRVLGGGASTYDSFCEAVAWVRSHGVHCQIDLNPFDTNRGFMAFLAREGFITRGYSATLFAETAAVSGNDELPTGITISLADAPQALEWVTHTKLGCFDVTADDEAAWQRDAMAVTFAQPEWLTYIAYVDGQPAGFAQLHVANGVGSLAVAGTQEAYRGRGVQSALIHRRIADAAQAGCDLIVAQTALGDGSQHNMMRAGLQVAYTKATMTDRKPGPPIVAT